MPTKRKTTTAIVAGVAAAALLLGGTFAWTSISQQAKNESAGIVNVGGRLHDDFNGENKDIYVENFTDPLNGGQPIYARIRLDEYMEVGSEAGEYDADSNSYVADRNAKPVVDTANIDDVTTWTTHVPAETCDNCATNESCKIHEHWKWTMGNDDAKYFMPTFNKDKDSLKADINGTYHGLNNADNVYYDDYVEYKEKDTKTDTAYYDDDTDTQDNNGTRQENETHTAKLTGTAQVVLMEDWDGEAGNYWVYDTDGWAYWANPIMPGESTGFLLDNIEMIKNPGEKCYYAINVVAQFATVGDWENFYTDPESKDYDVSEKAQELLETAAAAVPVVTVTNVSGATTVEQGKTYDFTATVTKGATANASITAGDFEWTVYDENMVESETSTIVTNDNGGVTLNVGASEQSKALIIAARCTDAKYLGATGLASVAVNVKIIPKYEIAPSNTTEDGMAFDGYLMPGNTYNLALMLNGEPVEDVTFSMSYIDTQSSGDAGELSDQTTLVDGVLSIASDELYKGSYSSYFNIVEVTACDSEGSVVTTRRFLISDAGFRIEHIIFVDEQGNETKQYETVLEVGKTYTWKPVIQEANNFDLQDWLSLSDVGREIDEFYVAKFHYDQGLGENIYTPSTEEIAISKDWNSITVLAPYSGDDLVVCAIGTKVNEITSFNIKQSVTTVKFDPLTISATKNGAPFEPSSNSSNPDIDFYNPWWMVDNTDGETVVVTFNRNVYRSESYQESLLEGSGVEVEIDGNVVTITFSGTELTGEYSDIKMVRVSLKSDKAGETILLDFQDIINE